MSIIRISGLDLHERIIIEAEIDPREWRDA